MDLSIFVGTIWNEFCLEERGTELERNEFQLRIGWNGTERVPKKLERSTTLDICIKPKSRIVSLDVSSALDQTTDGTRRIQLMLLV